MGDFLTAVKLVAAQEAYRALGDSRNQLPRAVRQDLWRLYGVQALTNGDGVEYAKGNVVPNKMMIDEAWVRDALQRLSEAVPDVLAVDGIPANARVFLAAIV